MIWDKKIAQGKIENKSINYTGGIYIFIYANIAFL